MTPKIVCLCCFLERSIPDVTITKVANGYVCGSCVHFTSQPCYACNQVNTIGEPYIYNKRKVCENCNSLPKYSSLYEKCQACWSRTHKCALLNIGRSRTSPQEYVCWMCYANAGNNNLKERPYIQCGGCYHAYLRNEVKRHPNGIDYCQHCYPDEYNWQNERVPNLDRPTRTRNDFLGGQYCGLEIECYHKHPSGRPFAERVPKWGWTYDGSIKGYPTEYKATEFLSPIMWGNKALEDLAEFLGQLKPKVMANTNLTCGLHVHVQSSDLSPQQVANVLMLWEVLEDWAFDAMPAHRRTIKHSRPIKGLFNRQRLLEVGSPEDLAKVVYNLPELPYRYLDSIKNNKYNEVRYRSLNAHSHFFKGTLEFRMHSGTLNWRKIRHWMEVCTKVVDIGKTKSNWTLNEFLAQLDKATVEHYQERTKKFKADAYKVVKPTMGTLPSGGEFVFYAEV